MKNILLVDDDKDLSQSLANLFDPEKFNFAFLEDGTEVGKVVRDRRDLDLVMLDVNLPTMSRVIFPLVLTASNSEPLSKDAFMAVVKTPLFQYWKTC